MQKKIEWRPKDKRIKTVVYKALSLIVWLRFLIGCKIETIFEQTSDNIKKSLENY